MDLLDTLNHPSMLHAAVVHFPIVLFFVCIAGAAATLLFPRSTAVRVLALLSFIALACSCVIAEETGEKAYGEVPGELDQVIWDQVHEHEELAELLKFFAAAGALLMLISFIPHPYTRNGGATCALIAAIGGGVLCGLTAHYGGDLVYRHGVGTTLLKQTLAKEAESPHVAAPKPEEGLVPIRDIDPAEAAKVSYVRDIAPIMENRCVDCHEGPDGDGAYDVTSVAGLLAAGEEHGPGVVPGDPDGSPVVKFIRGELKPRMPKRKPPLSEEELHLIRLWISAGAVDDSKQDAAPAEETPAPMPEPEPIPVEPEPLPTEEVTEIPAEVAPEVTAPVVVEEAVPAEDVVTEAPVMEEPVTAPAPEAEPMVEVPSPEPASEPAPVSETPVEPLPAPVEVPAAPITEEMRSVADDPAVEAPPMEEVPAVSDVVSETPPPATETTPADSGVVKFDPFSAPAPSAEEAALPDDSEFEPEPTAAGE